MLEYFGSSAVVLLRYSLRKGDGQVLCREA